MNAFTQKELLELNASIQRIWIRAIRERMAPEAGMSRVTFLEIVGWEKSFNWLEALENGRIKKIPREFLEKIYAACEVPDEEARAAMCPHLVKLVETLKERYEP